MHKMWMIILVASVSSLGAQDKKILKKIDSINLIKTEVHQKLNQLDSELSKLLGSIHQNEINKKLKMGVKALTINCPSELYSEPDFESQVIQVVPSLSSVVLQERKGTYYQVLYNNYNGYLLFNSIIKSSETLAFDHASAEKAELENSNSSKKEARKQKQELQAIQAEVIEIRDEIQEKLDYYESIEDFVVIDTEFKMNTVGGVSPTIHWKYNQSNRDIRQVEFTLEPYNAIGDVTISAFSSEPKVIVRLTGPISAKEEIRNTTWDNAWYNENISCIKIRKVKISYMNGQSTSYVRYLPRVLSKYFNNNCSYQVDK